jgi:dipeptide/tripeptide permease
MDMSGNLGGAISPTLIPYIARQYEWKTALFVDAGRAIVWVTFWLGVHPERAIELQEKEAPIVQQTGTAASAMAREGVIREKNETCPIRWTIFSFA